MFNRRLAPNSSFSACFPSTVRFSQRESKVYFCPLMKRRSFPERARVSNSLRGYHFFSEVGTRLKYVGFSEVALVPVRDGFFSRIVLTTPLFRPKIM